MINTLRSGMTLLMLFLLTLGIAQEQLDRLSQIDVLHYTFDLTLSDQTNTIDGRALVRLRLLQPMDQVALDLQSRQNDAGMEVQSIQLDGEELEYSHQDQSLRIFLPKGLTAGTNLDLQIAYQGVPQDGLIIGENRFGSRTFFGDNWPNRARHWLPTVDHPSDKATVEWIVTAPGVYQVVANGRQTEETTLPDGRRLTRFATEVPLPTKVMVIGVAPFAVQYAGDANGIPVTSWVFPDNREEGFYDYQPAVSILEWFMEEVGPYPYLKLANVQSKTRYGGMENAGNIFYFENSVTGKRERNALIAHEIAHQWFGNSATEGSWYHVWLSEGFATYFTHLWVEATEGREVLDERLQADRLQVLRYGRRRSAPIIDPSVRDFNQLLNPNSYQKGGWVLHMLRRKIGDQAFWQGIRTYYRRYQLRNALTEDLRAVMEEVSGQDLQQFFDQWLRQPGFPDLEVQWNVLEGGGTAEVTITQKQDELFTFPLTIQVADTELSDLGTKSVEISGRTQTVRVPFSGKAETLVLDPETDLLFTAGIVRDR
jgi:aminopeptidase N